MDWSHCSADDSSSMKHVDKGERIDDLNAIVEKVTEVATLFDDDGITVSPGLETAGALRAIVRLLPSL